MPKTAKTFHERSGSQTSKVFHLTHLASSALLRLNLGKILQKTIYENHFIHHVFCLFNKRAIPYKGITGNSALCCSMDCGTGSL